MNEDSALAPAADEIGVELLDLDIVQLNQLAAKRALALDWDRRAVASPKPLADSQLARPDPAPAVHRPERVPPAAS